MKSNNTSRKLAVSVATIVLLAICLCITTFALMWAVVSKDNSLFHTGTVKINLNDGNPVIQEHEFLFEPGMTVKKDFFIENQSTCDVYYKLYFDNVEGGLADVLEIAIYQEDTVLFEGKASELIKENVGAANDVLKMNERKNLTIYFHFPEEAGNTEQDKQLTFDMKADAVQTRNNPDKRFD